MRMIPTVPSAATTSAAEQKVFEFLGDARAGPDACCIHSLRLSRHHYKELGELDFVVITARGILVIEVKGGAVARDGNGMWNYRNRYHEVYRNREGPFRQAESGMYSMRDMLVQELGDLARTVPIGFAVVFPDCRFDVRTVEWDSDLVLDKDGLTGTLALQHFVEQALKVTRARLRRNFDLPVASSTLHRITGFLRPSFDMVPTLGETAGQLV